MRVTMVAWERKAVMIKIARIAWDDLKVAARTKREWRSYGAVVRISPAPFHVKEVILKVIEPRSIKPGGFRSKQRVGNYDGNSNE